MSRRVIAFKKMMILLSMGGAAFTFGLFGAGDFGCVSTTNADLVSFYTDLGDTSIDCLADDARANGVTADFDQFVLTPATAFIKDVWGNWVGQQFPRDVW